MKYFIFLNEFTVVRALILALLNRPVYLAPSEPLFGLSSKLVTWLARWMEGRGNVHSVFDDLPDSRRYWSVPGYSIRTDVFVKLENQINKRFDFNKVDQGLGDYAMSFKVEACKYMSERVNATFLVHDISQKYGPEEAAIILTNEDLIFTYEKYYGEPPRPRIVRPKQFRPAINFGIFIGVLIFALTWAMSRLRWRKYSRRPFFMGADFSGGSAQIKLIRDIIGDPKRCLLVFRNKAQEKNNSTHIGGFAHCINNHGVIAISDLYSIIKLIVKDTLKLYVHSAHLTPGHMLSVLKLPHKKAVYRVLFNRFQFNYFWCRDDYNSDHILRSQELRRVGSVSLGINHGMPSPIPVEPSWRYIDYDIYYVFGTHVPAVYYADTWARGMLIRPVGSLGMTREFLSRMSAPRPKDIIYFVAPNTYEEKGHQAVLEVARAFPEKKIWVKIKQNLKDRGYYDAFIKSLQNGPENLFLTETNSYELMFDASYALACESTVIVEAIQFGLNAFSFDFHSDEKPFLYRAFPNLCVRTSAEAIARILDIDKGKEVYPRREFDNLIKLSGPYIIDAIRSDMGLGPSS